MRATNYELSTIIAGLTQAFLLPSTMPQRQLEVLLCLYTTDENNCFSDHLSGGRWEPLGCH